MSEKKDITFSMGWNTEPHTYVALMSQGAETLKCAQFPHQYILYNDNGWFKLKFIIKLSSNALLVLLATFITPPVNHSDPICQTLAAHRKLTSQIKQGPTISQSSYIVQPIAISQNYKTSRPSPRLLITKYFDSGEDSQNYLV